jgi:tetratricopeptide (TPR) repeat protein
VCKEVVEKLTSSSIKDVDDPFVLYLHAYAQYLMGNSCNLNTQSEEKQFLYNQCDTKTRQAITLVEHEDDENCSMELRILKVKLHFLLARALLQNTIHFKIEQTKDGATKGSLSLLATTTDYSDKFFQEVCVTMDKAQQLVDKCNKMYTSSNAKTSSHKDPYQIELISLTAVMHFHFGKILTEWSTFRRQRWEPLCDKAKICYEQCMACVKQNKDILSTNISVSCLEELGTLQLYQIRRRRELSSIYSKSTKSLDLSSDKSNGTNKNWQYDAEDVKLIDKCIETWEQVIDIEQEIKKNVSGYEINEENNLRCSMALLEKGNAYIPCVSLIYELHILHDSLYDDDKIASMLTRSYNEHDLTFKNRLIRDRNQLITKFSDRMKQLEQVKVANTTSPTPLSKQSSLSLSENNDSFYNILLGTDSDLILTDSQVTSRNGMIDKAIKVLSAGLQQNPTNSGVLLALGRMYFEKGAIKAIQSHFFKDCSSEFESAATQLTTLIKHANTHQGSPILKLAQALLGEVYFFNAKGKTSVEADSCYAKAVQVWTDCVSSDGSSRSKNQTTSSSNGRSSDQNTLSRSKIDKDKNEAVFKEDIKELLNLTKSIRTDNILLDGEMIKLGAVRKNWNIRYFTLTVEHMSYYDSRKTMKLKKRVSTNTIKSIRQADSNTTATKKPLNEFPHMLEVNVARRTFHIGFKQEEELVAWSKVLEYIIEHKQTTATNQKKIPKSK